MKTLKIISIVAVFAAMVGCQSSYLAKVNFDRNAEVDTSNYKTFAWLQDSKIIAAPVDLNPVMKSRIDVAIEESFRARGYKLVDSAENADFTVSYTLGSRDKVKVDSYPTTYRTGFAWGRGYYGGYGGVSMGTETHVRNYQEGKLAVDVFDVKTKEPVWHGWAVKRISTKNQENPGAEIQPIVDQVINQF